MATSVVVDASTVLRGLVDGHPQAVAWLARADAGELSLHWPSLLYLEVANGLLRLQRGRGITLEGGGRLLRATLRIPARWVPVERLTEEAWALAGRRRLSAYDACYVVLAETLAAPLVTADRRLAAATANGVLISP